METEFELYTIDGGVVVLHESLSGQNKYYSNTIIEVLCNRCRASQRQSLNYTLGAQTIIFLFHKGTISDHRRVIHLVVK